MKHIKKEYDINGKKLTLETGLFANQATSSVKVSIGDGEYSTTVLGTVVVGRRKDVDWLPLQVVYEERFYASGKIKDSQFNKREGRPSDNAVLSGRLIDRSLRSAINDNTRNDIQTVVTVLEIDKINKPDTLGVLALSLCLKMAKIESLGKESDKKYFWCFKSNSFIDKPEFEEGSQKSLVLVSNNYNDDSITLYSGVSTKNAKKLVSDDENIKLCQKIILEKKLYVVEPEFEKNNYIIDSKNIVDLNNQDVFTDPISSVRVAATKTSVFKSLIHSLMNKLSSGEDSFLALQDVLSVIIWHDMFNDEVKSLISNKLTSISKELGIKFHQLYERLSKSPYQNIENIDLDESIIDYIPNPSYEDLKNSDLNLIVSGNGQNITMIEAGANFLPRNVVLKAIEIANDEIKKICEVQQDFLKEFNK